MHSRCRGNDPAVASSRNCRHLLLENPMDTRQLVERSQWAAFGDFSTFFKYEEKNNFEKSLCFFLRTSVNVFGGMAYHTSDTEWYLLSS